jgi:3-deoxy-D-manno-octulosonate 8-phosphate phosphatase (KDO 8-P phosphatase)
MNALPEALQKKIRTIRLLLCDVDGVLTDGKIIYDDTGAEIKAFNVRDGHGIKLIQRAGIKVGIITSRESEVVRRRAKDLGISMVYQKVLNKLEAFNDILNQGNYAPHEIAYIGDDLVDIPVLRRVGLSVAVSDCIGEVRELVDYITQFRGGRGAVREVCELILKIQGKWQEVTDKYFA